MTLAELMIAALITTVGILALLSMHPTAWRASGRSDLMGRAAGILHEELETNEMFIMNPCNAVVSPSTTLRNVLTSGAGAAQPGDFTYGVQTDIADNGSGLWTVTVRVTWPGNAVGIAETILVTRQERFRFPEGCL